MSKIEFPMDHCLVLTSGNIDQVRDAFGDQMMYGDRESVRSYLRSIGYSKRGVLFRRSSNRGLFTWGHGIGHIDIPQFDFDAELKKQERLSELAPIPEGWRLVMDNNEKPHPKAKTLNSHTSSWQDRTAFYRGSGYLSSVHYIVPIEKDNQKVGPSGVDVVDVVSTDKDDDMVKTNLTASDVQMMRSIADKLSDKDCCDTVGCDTAGPTSIAGRAYSHFIATPAKSLKKPISKVFQYGVFSVVVLSAIAAACGGGYFAWNNAPSVKINWKSSEDKSASDAGYKVLDVTKSILQSK